MKVFSSLLIYYCNNVNRSRISNKRHKGLRNPLLKDLVSLTGTSPYLLILPSLRENHRIWTKPRSSENWDLIMLNEYNDQDWLENFGGCAGIAVGHPLDTVKVCLQTQDSQNPKYRNTFHCLQSIFAKEGIRGIYRGVTSPLLGVAGINAIVFGIYGNTQRWMKDSDSLRCHAIAGAAAGFVQSFICSPMEMVKSRMQVGDTSKDPLECLKKIYRNNGTRGVFKGLGLTILREIPAFSSYFCTYEFLTRRNDDLPVSTFAMLMGGGFAGVVSWAIVYPIDVLKSRFQIDGLTSTKYTSSYDCFAKSVKGEGISCLFRGLAPTLLRAFPVNAVTFTVVTWTMKLCSEVNLNVTERVKGTETIVGKCADAVLLSTAEYAAYAAL